PALVANQYSVLDSSATAFAKHFYRALATGQTLADAARESRIAGNYALQGEAIDWAIPVVYARDPQLRFCTPASSRSAVPRRARAPSKPVAVAVWDVDHAFPALADTLERLDAAQPVFGFRLADVSAPVSAWDVDNRAPDGGPYLWAERVAGRLARLPMELQVQVVVCVTRHWLRDDDTLNIYAWWPEPERPGVLILSSAGLDELPAEGALTDAFFANVIAASLGGYFGGLGTHARGPKSCPLWRNPARDLAPLQKPQTFDARCREALRQARPDLVEALDALAQAVGGESRG
ncbi:MAG: hypothetical protein KDJ14_12290, partial [Xanthomonadales bacterium]|nr:hypothetical protein [Xanthomonadales bacterium]